MYKNQWGVYPESEGTTNYKSFPIAFPSACVAYSANTKIASAGDSKHFSWMYVHSKSQFVGGNADDNQGGGNIYIIAIGY